MGKFQGSLQPYGRIFFGGGMVIRLGGVWGGDAAARDFFFFADLERDFSRRTSLLLLFLVIALVMAAISKDI